MLWPSVKLHIFRLNPENMPVLLMVDFDVTVSPGLDMLHGFLSNHQPMFFDPPLGKTWQSKKFIPKPYLTTNGFNR